MERAIDRMLLEWKSDPQRLVLLLRGARQVGKTHSVRQLGATFKHYVEVNFEERATAKSFFEGDLVAGEVCEKLSAYFRIPIVPGETLVFFDEVQECPNCLRALRFFHEQMPELHVVAAGALLEFALAELPSFGVGRIQSAYMFPLSFAEFLRAEGSGSLWDYVCKRDDLSAVDSAFHLRLLERMRVYMLIGGMPAVVDSYCRNRDLRKCQDLLSAILSSLYADFAKYSGRIGPMVLRDTFRSVSLQAGGKFKYSAVDADLPGRSAKAALELLCQAGLVHRVWHSDARGIPLGAARNPQRFKAIPVDIGIHQRMLGLDLADLLVADLSVLVHRGHLAEVMVGLELLSASSPLSQPELHYWHREGRDTNAEVDYVVQQRNQVVPVEVKSGHRGAMQSMRLFLRERNLPYGIRLSQENVSRYDDILSLPTYMAGRLVGAHPRQDTLAAGLAR